MKQLKKVKLTDGKIYFVDWRLRQLRNVENPHDFIDFRDEDEMAAQLAVDIEIEVI